MEKSYGVTFQKKTSSDIDIVVEEVQIKGFSLLENVLSEDELHQARQKLDSIYKQQADHFKEDVLASIGEKNMVRAPFAYDEYFLYNVAANKKVLEVIQRLIGEYFILHLQNGIINKPNEAHHQNSWHRDLPYQNFVSSRSLAIGALYCIDDFTVENGCTNVVPFSHKVEMIPSAEYIDLNKVPVVAKAGSVILFDSMLFHKAGYNGSAHTRRGINNVYVVPIIKQQINIPTLVGEKYKSDPFFSRFLGYDSEVPATDVDWRLNRIKRLKNG